MMNRLPIGTTLLAGSLLCLSATAQARQYIGFSQPGTPDTWAWQLYPVFQPNSAGTNSAYSFAEVAYFTKTGFTGTTQDQFEYWAGGSIGYSNTKGAPGSSGYGLTIPEIGIEYYYNVLVPTSQPGAPDFRSFWVSPTLDFNFANGNTQTSGYGAGGDNYNFDFNINTFNQWGKILLTFNPAEFNYAFRNMNSSPTGTPGVFFKARGGLSVTVADLSIAYQVTPDLAVGIMQQFNINNMAGSDFHSSREGFIGPGFTYAGYANIGLFFAATVQEDYYEDHTPHNTYFAAWVTKTF